MFPVLGMRVLVVGPSARMAFYTHHESHHNFLHSGSRSISPMEVEDEFELPPLRWQRASSLFWNRWLVHNDRSIMAVVDEVGRYLRTWVFYLLEEDHWVELIEFGSLGPPIEGVQSCFGEIVEYAAAVNPSYACVLIVERDVGTIWWLFYY
jgi:hypothetical protein